jgi:hypothetical protein
MKKISLLFAVNIVLLTGTLPMQADDLKYMVITMNGNGNMRTILPLADTPTLLVQGDLLEVQTAAVNMGNINKNAVKHITYSDTDEWQGIADAKVSGVAVSPRATTATVTITGLNVEADITLYNAAGKACNAAIARQTDMAIVDMTTLPKGIYILTINKESFKLVKK